MGRSLNAPALRSTNQPTRVMEKYSNISEKNIEAYMLAQEVNTALNAGGIIEGQHPTFGQTFKIKNAITLYPEKALIGINPEIHHKIKNILPDHMRVRMLSPEREDLAMYSFD